MNAFHVRSLMDVLCLCLAITTSHAATCPPTEVADGNVGAITSLHWVKRASTFMDGPLRKAALTMALNAIDASWPKASSLHTLPPLPATSDILQRAERHNHAFNCIYRIDYKSDQNGFVADHRNATHCTAFSSIARAMYLRVETFLRVLEFLVDSGKLMAAGFDQTTDFEFYIDVTDATPVDDKLFTALGRPLLSQSHSPVAGDRHTLPYPDHHQILGMASVAGYSVPPELEGDAVSLAEKYTGFNDASMRPWSDKKDAAVHRAQCVMTFGATMDTSGRLRLLPVRGDVCQHAQTMKSDDVDVGTATNEDTPSSLSGLCSPCSRREFVDWKKMASQWRYIVNTDGYGMSYDGSFWKLAANSTVFWVASGSIDARDVHTSKSTDARRNRALASGPYWQTWYSALLRPWCHYVPVKVDGVMQALERCRRNERACSQIADRASRAVRTIVTHDTMLQHLTATLVAVQGWQQATLCALRAQTLPKL